MWHRAARRTVAGAALLLTLLTTGPLPAAAAANPRPLPSNLTPSLAAAATSRPRSYADGCHRRPGQTTVKTCIYGDRHGTRKVALMGDLHAAMWLSALDPIAARRHWKLYSVTKSGCPFVEVDLRPDCNAWRRNAMTFIARIHPDLVIVATDQPYTIKAKGAPTSSASKAAWRAGEVAALTTLVAASDAVVFLGGTPTFETDVAPCLRHHRRDTRACDAPRSFALSPGRETVDRQSAAAAGAIFTPVATMTCPDDPCPSVVGRYMVAYDDHHLTPAWVRHLAPRLEARLPLP